MSRVMVVEDDPAIRSLLVDLLLSEGHAVRQAATGAAAVREFERETPDAMILDLQLPDVNAPVVAEACHELAAVPILLMSASPSLGGAADQLRRFGVQGFIAKPFNLEVMLAAVERLTAVAA